MKSSDDRMREATPARLTPASDNSFMIGAAVLLKSDGSHSGDSGCSAGLVRGHLFSSDQDLGNAFSSNALCGHRFLDTHETAGSWAKNLSQSCMRSTSPLCRSSSVAKTFNYQIGPPRKMVQQPLTDMIFHPPGHALQPEHVLLRTRHELVVQDHGHILGTNWPAPICRLHR